MKVLLFSGMFPKYKNYSSGIFIINRLKELIRSNEIEVDFAPVSTYDDFFISIVKDFTGKSVLKLPKKIQILDREYPVLKIKLKNKIRINMFKRKLPDWIYYSKKIAEKLENSFKIENYELIHAHRLFPEGYSALILSKKYNIPFVTTTHGSELHGTESSWRETILEILNNASKNIFVSNFLKKQANKIGYDGKNYKVIPNGINTRLFRPLDRHEVRKKLGLINNNYKYVGFVGNLEYVKRADKFPEIFNKISKKYPKAKFLIVGDGSLKNEVIKKTRDLSITFFGKVPHEQVPKYLNAMDVVILPSRNEGWPCVVLEAQACGVPVVGSNNGGIPEAINRSDLIVKESKNFENEFALKTVETLRNPIKREEIRKNAISYNWTEIIKKEIAVYKNSSYQ